MKLTRFVILFNRVKTASVFRDIHSEKLRLQCTPMLLLGVELPDSEVVSFCSQVCEMATDISESSGADCKGDTKNSAKLDADYPLRVLYCGGKCRNDLLTDFYT